MRWRRELGRFLASETYLDKQYALLLTLCIALLAMFAYLGTYSRPQSDDLCHIGETAEMSVWEAVLFERHGYNGSSANIIVMNLLGTAGHSGCSIVPGHVDRRVVRHFCGSHSKSAGYAGFVATALVYCAYGCGGAGQRGMRQFLHSSIMVLVHSQCEIWFAVGAGDTLSAAFAASEEPAEGGQTAPVGDSGWWAVLRNG